MPKRPVTDAWDFSEEEAEDDFLGKDDSEHEVDEGGDSKGDIGSEDDDEGDGDALKPDELE